MLKIRGLNYKEFFFCNKLFNKRYMKKYFIRLLALQIILILCVQIAPFHLK